MFVPRLLFDLAQRFAEDGSTLEQFGLPTPQGIDTELQREKLRWKHEEETVKLLGYISSSPNTPEMANLFSIITRTIDEGGQLFIYIQGLDPHGCLFGD